MTEMATTGSRGYHIVAQQIRDWGVTVVFGLMSEDTAMLVVALEELGVEFSSVRHENVAVAAAEGYASATGALGVALIGRGPATANAMNAIAYTVRTGSKVLVICGDGPLAPSPIGPDEKAFNSAGVIQAAGLQVIRPTGPASLAASVVDACLAAEKGKAVALLLPTDVQRADVGYSAGEIGRQRPATPAAREARPQAVAAAADLLSRCSRPLIVAGAGAHRSGARASIEALAKKTGALLATSAKAKDLFRGSPFNLGVLGSFSHSLLRQHAEQADCVLVFGAGLNRRTTSSGEAFPENTPIIQIDEVQGRIGLWQPAEIGLVGDASRIAAQLLAALPERALKEKPFHAEETLEKIRKFRTEDDFSPIQGDRTVDPRLLAIALDRMLPDDRNVVYDAGNFLGIFPYLPVEGPANAKLTVDFASIGLGFGTAIGFAKAKPQTITVLIVGDGGFLMTMGEIETVARLGLPMLILVMNDSAYGAEAHFLEFNEQSPSMAKFPEVDFSQVAEAFGFATATVRNIEDFESLRSMISSIDAPVLIDCKINPTYKAAFLSEAKPW